MNKVSHMANVSGPLNVRLVNIEILRAESAANIMACTRWLRRMGLEILKVEDGRFTPRIYIRAGKECELLDGAVRAYEHVGGLERRYFTLIRHECEVRWADHGGNA